jgi:divalent metal cation (Fe/Co/Zn/Cd) transporter
MGVVIAGSAMGLSVHYASHIPDAVGSIAIGGLLGTVAMFMIRTNAFALVGRSIPEEKIKEINEDLEGDIMVRQIMDVKGIDMGNGIVRWVNCLPKDYSLLEALILASINPKYDNRLFIELRAHYTKTTSSIYVVYIKLFSFLF